MKSWLCAIALLMVGGFFRPACALATTRTGNPSAAAQPSAPAPGDSAKTDEGNFGQQIIERMTAPTKSSFNLTIFGGGYMSQDVGLTSTAIQAEQSLTEGLGLMVRITGVQLYLFQRATSPLAPSNQAVGRLNYGRFQVGFDLKPTSSTSIMLLGGRDVGDSDAWSFETDISQWLLMGYSHPVNVFLVPSYDTQNLITSSEIDLTVMLKQNQSWAWMAGLGDTLSVGGFIHGVDGSTGPVMRLFYLPMQLGGSLYAGYGSTGYYGMIILSKGFTLSE
jgi:hypothetical protein